MQAGCQKTSTARISEGVPLLCFRPSQVEPSQTRKVLNWRFPNWSKQFVSGVRNGTDIKISLSLWSYFTHLQPKADVYAVGSTGSEHMSQDSPLQ